MGGPVGAIFLAVTGLATVALRDAQPDLSGRMLALSAAAIGGATLAVSTLAFVLGRLAWTAGDPRLATSEQRAHWWSLAVELAPVSAFSVAAATALAGHATWPQDVYAGREPWLIVTALLGLVGFLVIAVRRQRRAAGSPPLRLDAASASTLVAELGGASGIAAVVGYPLAFAGMILGLAETSPLAASFMEYGLVAMLGTLALIALHATMLSAIRGQWGGTIHAGPRGPRTGVLFRLSGALAFGSWAAVFARGWLYPEVSWLRSPVWFIAGTLAIVVAMLVRPEHLSLQGRR